MTEALAEKAGRVICVELGKNLSEIAATQLVTSENVDIINTDILESKNTLSQTVTKALDLAGQKYTGRMLLVANLPYSAASPVIMNLITGPKIADCMYVTVQREVADRMIASPGSSHYGILSIFLAAAGDVKMIRTLKPAVFWPQPQVDSAMVCFIRNRAKSDRIKNMELFSEIVHLFMGHRRKTLISCSKLAHGKLAKITNWPEIFEQCSICPTKRPETLDPEDYIAIANYAGYSLFLY